MTLDELRSKMASYRQSADLEAGSMKDPYMTLDRLRAMYDKFEPSERQMADQVLAEWALAESEGIRFDAKALIDDLDIISAVPALRELTSRLASSSAPSARYEIETANRIIEKLLKANIISPDNRLYSVS